MPPPRSIRPLAGLRLIQPRRILNRPSLCLFCSAARSQPAAALPRKALRSYATTAEPEPQTNPTTPTTPLPPADPRIELENALLDLKKYAANYVNLSRLQLALLGLRQPAGEESVRVAVLGVNNGQAGPSDAAKEVLRLLLADPLKDEQEWERRLEGVKRGVPVLVKVGQDKPEGGLERKSMFEEVYVSAPGFDGHKIEILLMGVNAPAGDKEKVEEALLDLPVDIISGANRFSPIRTPVHKTVLVADGIMGVPSVGGLPPNEEDGAIFSAVNLPGYQPEADAAVPFLPVDVAQATKGVSLFRQSPAHGMDYERLWSQSRVSGLSSWVKTGTASHPGTTKPVVRSLIASVIQNTTTALETSPAQTAVPAANADVSKVALRRGLADWAQSAHGELRDKLDLAFTGRRWRKLNWWKLFWRVDDVGTLTSDIVTRDFLPTAERRLVFLAGQVASSGGEVSYPQPTSLVSKSEGDQRWPTHIAFTKRYLLEETVPALQALAQKLVLQAASTTGLTGSLAGLLFVSGWSTNLFEAGAVAALGAVWSLWRLQGKWEAARGFWEGEVREEGRKAVRGAERSMGEALEGEAVKEGAEEQRARELVAKARDALERLK